MALLWKNAFTYGLFPFLPWLFCFSLLCTFWTWVERTVLILHSSSAPAPPAGLLWVLGDEVGADGTRLYVSVQKQEGGVGRTATGLGARTCIPFECFQSVRMIELQMCPMANKATCLPLQRGGCGLALLCNTLLVPQLRYNEDTLSQHWALLTSKLQRGFKITGIIVCAR